MISLFLFYFPLSLTPQSLLFSPTEESLVPIQNGSEHIQKMLRAKTTETTDGKKEKHLIAWCESTHPRRDGGIPRFGLHNSFLQTQTIRWSQEEIALRFGFQRNLSQSHGSFIERWPSQLQASSTDSFGQAQNFPLSKWWWSNPISQHFLETRIAKVILRDSISTILHCSLYAVKNKRYQDQE
jgi:hypothetical protein